MYRKVASKLIEKFVLNKNVAAIQQKNTKYYTVKSPITVDLITEMLRSGYSLGTYQQLTYQNQLKWICFDFDCKDYKNKNDLLELKQNYVEILLKKLDDYQIKYTIEFSGRRGIHVWIIFDQIVDKDIAFLIVQKLREDFYLKISYDPRYDVDCFPKTGSGKKSNKYGLQVKLPLSRHQGGTYSYFISRDEEHFDSVTEINSDFLLVQLDYLEKIEENSIEYILEVLNVPKIMPTEQIIKYHRKMIIEKHELSIMDIKNVFLTDNALRNLWMHIDNGQLSSAERIIILGIFSHMKSGEDILFEIMKKQKNYNEQITHKMIAKYKKYYYPISFNYLYELMGLDKCPENIRNEFIDEYIFKCLNVPYTSVEINRLNDTHLIQSVIEKEINYLLYNDEVYNFSILNKMYNFTYYDYCMIDEITKRIESGNYTIPANIECYKYIRKEEDKERKLISLGAQERVITSVLINKLIMYMQTDYKSYSYHLNFGIGGDIFYPWISSWSRFKNDISQYFSFPIFDNYSFAKVDIKGFYDNIYLQSMYEEILKNNKMRNYSKFVNIFIYLNQFNEKLMLENYEDLRGVPQGPAYARVLAEIVLDSIINKFVKQYGEYKDIRIYRYVDDMFIFFPVDSDKNMFMELFSLFLEKYGIYLNLKKTKLYGKIGDLSIEDKKELQEFRDLNYDIFQLRENNWINEVDQDEYDNIYIRYIYRRKKWDINDANIMLSDKISSSLQNKYLHEFYYEILQSEYGRGTLFRKFYNIIFNDAIKYREFIENRDYEKIPTESINYQNMLGSMIIYKKNISVFFDKKECFILLINYLKERKKLEEVNILIKILSEEADCER